MRTFQAVLFIALMAMSAGIHAQGDYTHYDISVDFEVTESAIDQYLKNQVFPQPEGTYEDGEYYTVTLLQPDIEITENSITFNSEIIATVTISGNTNRYIYPISVPVSIPAGNLTITEISGYLQNIPTAINNLYGPQWIKNIIIDAYAQLNLHLYPNQFIEEINAQIPTDLDIIINDFDFEPVVSEEVLQIIVTVPVDTKARYAEGQWFIRTHDNEFGFHFRSNVQLNIVGYSFVNTMNGAHWENENVGITLTPNEWSDWIIVQPGDEDDFVEGVYKIKVFFETEYGWFAMVYTLNTWLEGGGAWNDFSNSTRL